MRGNTKHFIIKGALACMPGLISVGFAHAMPNSNVLLSVQEKQVQAEVQLPLSQLELALKPENPAVTLLKSPEQVPATYGKLLTSYLLKHVKVLSPEGTPWTVQVNSLSTTATETTDTGPYSELIASLTFTPPAGVTAKTFTLKYDAIMHQVANHSAFVSVKQNWDQGILEDHPMELGVIQVDVVSNTVPAFKVDQSGGSLWSGFVSIFKLGMQHIREGTDHLLFLLVLLFPAPLLLAGKKWGGFRGTKGTFSTLLKVITAFTLGHSVTLLLGALGWVKVPSQPIEVLIAFSILVSALHALRPLFPGRETLIAAGFGLVHGLAFAGTIVGLGLDAFRMALTILGFNLGIEVMQLVVMLVTVPWLILLARTRMYPMVRITGAVLSGVAAVGWMVQRITGQDNMLSRVADALGTSGVYLICLMALLAVLSSVVRGQKSMLQN